MKGRPTKLTPEVLKTLQKVITDNVLFCTDQDLIFLLNEALPEKNRFSYEAFSKWKRGERQRNSALYPEFVRLIKKALLKEKRTLLMQLKTGQDNWQARAWILERKFDEWNLKARQSIEAVLQYDKLSDESLNKIVDDLLKCIQHDNTY